MFPSWLKAYKPAIIKSGLMFVFILGLFFFLSPYLIWYLLALVISVVMSVISIVVKLFSGLKLVPKKLFFGWLKSFAFLLIILYLNRWSVRHGVWGLIIIVLLLSAYKMWRSWDFLGRGKAEIEILIFGFPLRRKWRDRLGYSDEYVDGLKKANKRKV